MASLVTGHDSRDSPMIEKRPHLSPGLVGFLNDLEKNNNKDWFDAHRDTYRDVYVDPTLAFIEALSGPLSRLDPPLSAVPKVNGSLRRINRDVRFSKDKRPYSPMLHMIFSSGDKALKGPGVHVVVAHDHFGVGAGHWAFEPEQLDRYRQAVTTGTAAAELEKAVAAAARIGCVPDDPQLARVPRGYKADEPVATMLRRKGVVVRTHDQPIPDVLFEPGAVDFTVKQVTALMPLVAWLNRFVFDQA